MVIENLEVKCGRGPYTFTDGDGATQTYTTNASAIRIEAGEYITIRNCIMHDSANNFLTSGLSEEVVCEGCYIYDGGYGAPEHNIYTESHGITFQYNQLQPLRTSGTANEGINLKDRSASTCVRYNWIEGGVRQVNLVESYDYQTIRDYPGYGTEDRVYGNILIMNANSNGNEHFLYGGDMGTGYEQYYRSRAAQGLQQHGHLQAYRQHAADPAQDHGAERGHVQQHMVRACRNSVRAELLHRHLHHQPQLVHDRLQPYRRGFRRHGHLRQRSRLCRLCQRGLPHHLDVRPAATPAWRYRRRSCRPTTSLSSTSSTRPTSRGRMTARLTSEPMSTTPAYRTSISRRQACPTATSSVAYSQTLSAAGGMTPYTWSVVSGSLPAGLSLGSSTGMISGTPTTANTYNFTVRVTDSQGTPDTDDQALSITVTAVTEPTYRFTAADTETGTSSTTYVNKVSLAFTPAIADDWIILGFAEFRYSSTTYSGLLRMTVDGATVAESTMEPISNVQYITFSAMKAANLSTAAHTINIDYCSERSGTNNYVRRARILAIRKAALVQATAETDASTALTTTLTNYVTANFTPASTGDYLLVYSGEFYANSTAYSTQIQAKLNSTVLDETFVESRDTSDWSPFMSFAVANLPASAQTLSVAAAKETGSNAAHNIRRARVAAIRLTGGRFSGFQSAVSDGESTTTSMTYIEKLTKSWSVGTTADWAVFASMRLTNTATTYQTYEQVQLDNSTVLGENLRRPQDTTDWMNAGCIDVRELASGTRRVDVDFHTSSAAQTAKIKSVHLVALPLE